MPTGARSEVFEKELGWVPSLDESASSARTLLVWKKLDWFERTSF
jgi:hypothetical protein